MVIDEKQKHRIASILYLNKFDGYGDWPMIWDPQGFEPGPLKRLDLSSASTIP